MWIGSVQVSGTPASENIYFRNTKKIRFNHDSKKVYGQVILNHLKYYLELLEPFK